MSATGKLGAFFLAMLLAFGAAFTIGRAVGQPVSPPDPDTITHSH